MINKIYVLTSKIQYIYIYTYRFFSSLFSRAIQYINNNTTEVIIDGNFVYLFPLLSLCCFCFSASINTKKNDFLFLFFFQRAIRSITARIIKRRMSGTDRQSTSFIKKREKLADVVIVNSGSLEELTDQVEEVRKDVMGRLVRNRDVIVANIIIIGGSDCCLV